MSNETYRRFDPWRTAPVKEEVRKQIVASHYFNVDHVAFNSSEVGHFERYLVQENGGDTVGVLAVTEDANSTGGTVPHSHPPLDAGNSGGACPFP